MFRHLLSSAVSLRAPAGWGPCPGWGWQRADPAGPQSISRRAPWRSAAGSPTHTPAERAANPRAGWPCPPGLGGAQPVSCVHFLALGEPSWVARLPVAQPAGARAPGRGSRPPSVCPTGHRHPVCPQRTRRSCRRWRLSTRRCPGGRRTPRAPGSGRSCPRRRRTTSASWRTTWGWQVGALRRPPRLPPPGGPRPQRPSSLSVKWVGVGKSRDSIIQLF